MNLKIMEEMLLRNRILLKRSSLFHGTRSLGNLRWARSASIAEYLQSVEAQRALQMTIVAEVAQAYYELVALDTELDIVKQTLKAREEGVSSGTYPF